MQLHDMLAAWGRQAWRTIWLKRPDWRGLHATPALLACLLAADVALALVFERLYIAGDAQFYWPALTAGWFGTLLAAWVCWLLARKPEPGLPGAAELLAMLIAQGPPLMLVCGSVFVALMHSGALALINTHPLARWAAWLAPLLWTAAAMLVLLLRHTRGPAPQRGFALGLLVASLALHHWVQPLRHWYPVADGTDHAPKPLALTQQVWELQPKLLFDTLAALPAGRPGYIDTYSITFAPYADEDVFRRESAMVAALMAERFGADQRSVQLVNHRDTVHELPWATPLNLRRTIRRAAELMNPDEDLLFIHLTSHGARNGELAAGFEPLSLALLTPQQLKDWLDEFGVRHAVISVSACFSGSWIEPLRGPGVLVMSAADAEHTSYGCGRGSALTYYGRALFDEELRRTHSFEDAHAAARVRIAQREREAGKDDGYSNPQIAMGERVRPLLQRLAAQQAR